MSVCIPLWAHGEVRAYATVDQADAHLAERRWVLRVLDGRRYAETTTGPRDTPARFMHRIVLGLKKGDGILVDHINGDGLDNRRANLRLVTPAQNAQNQGSRGGSSSHRGVSWCNTRRRWLAQAQLDGRKINLGRYATEGEAAAAVTRWRAEHMPYSLEAAT